MSPAFGTDCGTGLLLKPVVADGSGGAQRFLDVAVFEQLSLVGVITSDSCVAIGL